MPVATLTLQTSDPQATAAVAAAIAPLLCPGDVVALSGELGAGKTCFVQGAARGLGIDARVTSPTFVLVRVYEGRLPMVHCDVYRLDRLQDVHELGDEVLAPDAVTFIEWGDAIAPLLPADRLEVELTLAGSFEDDGDRTVTIRTFGDRWAERGAALTAACRPWADPSMSNGAA